jgi:ferredoxin
MTAMRTTGAPIELLVDRVRCDGYGMCAELLPELIELDDWGYPILRSAVVPEALVDHARRAIEACPLLALRVRSAPGG